MAVKSESDNTPLPGTVFSPRGVRILKVVVIAMGVLLVGGFIFVIGVIAYQASNLGQGKSSTPDKPATASSNLLPGTETELAIPAGATVVSMALDGDRLALHLNSSAGPEIVVIDLTSGKVISRIGLNAQ
jgi:hypothetical protein